MRLARPLEIEEHAFNAFINEFTAAGEDLVPYSLNQKDMNFPAYIASLNDESMGKNLPENWVPASTYFLMDDENEICAAVSIRHRLTDALLIEGGHIGYGVRPSARKRGYGTTLLELALDKLKEMGVEKALLTCDKSNIHSARIIQKNGGELESEVEKDNKVVQRYWIQI